MIGFKIILMVEHKWLSNNAPKLNKFNLELSRFNIRRSFFSNLCQ